MVKFLLERPIAVLMAFTACCIVGVVAYFALPVSLLPAISIPQITVQIPAENSSARELENTVVSVVRRQLLQVTNLTEIKSETRDGIGLIRMSFDYGTDTDLAFIEVNEKIDATMGSLPAGIVRPKAIKASATDIPVFYLNMMLRKQQAYGENEEESFMQLCQVAEQVVRRRIEQLPQVAMADVTGIPERMVQIVPDMQRMKMMGITIEDVENALQNSNTEPGSMLVREGYCEFNVRISSVLRTITDVENIYLSKNGRLWQLKDFASVRLTTQQDKGLSVVNGKRAITLAVIKQNDENMDGLKKGLSETIDYFTEQYPDVEFSISRNQTELLDYTISNLQQNLIVGLILVFIVAAFFMGDVRSPLVIGISMLVSIVISLFTFFLFHVSLNIISLSGLILAVGMMIDSAIIVTENISQYREKGHSLFDACCKGTTEMITPMLSSSLTTIAVFVPLVFMSGIAGALFSDQAFGITAGLLVSYVTGIMLLPVLYSLLYKGKWNGMNWLNKVLSKSAQQKGLDRWYDRGMNWAFSHKTLCLALTMLTLPLCVWLFAFLPKEQMPQIDQNETVIHIDWNENIHVDENARRINELCRTLQAYTTEQDAYIGTQDFVLNNEAELSPSETELYIKTAATKDIAPLKKRITKLFAQEYPQASITFSAPETIFEKLFSSDMPDVEVRLHAHNRLVAHEVTEIQRLQEVLTTEAQQAITDIPFKNELNIAVNREKQLLYQVSTGELMRVLQTSFKESPVTTLRSFEEYLPITLQTKGGSVNNVLAQTMVSTTDGKQQIPLRELVTLSHSEDLKDIVAGKNGEYIPMAFYDVKDPDQLVEKVSQTLQKEKDWDFELAGSFVADRKLMNELVIIMLVSVLLMYFILCAQFESFTQPLIVLLEIPVDTAFALLSLWIFGYTLNLMSAIGIIVTCGIVVNDSILKLDSINTLRKNGMSLMDAIHTAGRKRLRAIVMTSLTTIFAILPLLFTSDMGSELQQPLAVAMIGSMVVGTLVSLFIIPLIYWFIYRKHETN